MARLAVGGKNAANVGWTEPQLAVVNLTEIEPDLHFSLHVGRLTANA